MSITKVHSRSVKHTVQLCIDETDAYFTLYSPYTGVGGSVGTVSKQAFLIALLATG